MRDFFKEMREWGQELYKKYLEPHGMEQVEWSHGYSYYGHSPFHNYKGVLNKSGLTLYYKREILDEDTPSNDEFILLKAEDVCPKLFVMFIRSLEKDVKEKVSQYCNDGLPGYEILFQALDEARGNFGKYDILKANHLQDNDPIKAE